MPDWNSIPNGGFTSIKDRRENTVAKQVYQNKPAALAAGKITFFSLIYFQKILF